LLEIARIGCQGARAFGGVDLGGEPHTGPIAGPFSKIDVRIAFTAYVVVLSFLFFGSEYAEAYLCVMFTTWACVTLLLRP